MTVKMQSKRTFPWTSRIGGNETTFRMMTPEDRQRILEFTKTLTNNDLIFLRTDLREPEVIDEWIHNLQTGRTITILAENDAAHIVGYASLHRNRMSWTRHLGEIRLFVNGDQRGTGLGRALATEIFQIAKEQQLDRIIVNISRNQPHVRQMLEKLGFTAEALLTDWLMDKEGHTHDLLIMSHRVDEF